MKKYYKCIKCGRTWNEEDYESAKEMKEIESIDDKEGGEEVHKCSNSVYVIESAGAPEIKGKIITLKLIKG